MQVEGKTLQHLLDLVRTCKDPAGRRRCEAFMRLPSKRDQGDYYSLVTYPIDLPTIQQRLRSDAYPDATAFVADVNLWLTNTLVGFAEDASICEDVEYILEVSIRDTHTHAHTNTHMHTRRFCLLILIHLRFK